METKRCSKCKEVKSIAEFRRHKGHKDGLRSECRECGRKQVNIYRKSVKGKEARQRYNHSAKGKEVIKGAKDRYNKSTQGKEVIQRYYSEHSAEITAKRRGDYRKNKEKEALTSHLRYQNNKEQILGQHNAYKRDLRSKVFEHYGLKCRICGEEDFDKLGIDHIYENGREHREEIGGRHMSGYHFYCWLINNGYPEGYQVLCMTCNLKKSALKRKGREPTYL